MVPVDENLPADAQHHRPVPHGKCRERRLRAGITASSESLRRRLAVGHPGGRATVEDQFKLPAQHTRCQIRHVRGLAMKNG